ncbi:hypothetical protein BDZ88DRAFT_424701 [Geranomyces variabilis]|nr:hypothetical protein BDZ88DRAFT_424701 [Geranomyces variabilis]KAJ3140744.1 hypothetical protein HDU90_008048 [Geranomyces variabilis]
MDLADNITTTTPTAMSSAQLEPVSGSESGDATPNEAPHASSGEEGDVETGKIEELERSTSIPPPPPATADDRPTSPARAILDVAAEDTSVAEMSMESGGGVAGEDEDGSGVGDAAAGTSVAGKDDPMDEDLPIGGGGESRESSLPPSGDTASFPQRQFHPIDVNRDTFAAVYANFLKLFHFQNPAARHCRLTEHLAKFDTPPKNQKRTFDTYDFYEVVKEIGGVEKIKSWSEVARRLGFDPRGTNIAARVKDWMVYHHIGAYFDFLLGISNEFFAHARGELDESDILSAITGVGKRPDQEGSVQDDQSQQGGQQQQLLSAKRRAKKSLEPLPSSRRRTGTIGSAASSVQGDSGSARWRPTGTGSDLEDYGTPNSSRERDARGSGSGTGGRSKTKLSSSRKSRKRSRSGSASSSGTASSRSRSSSRSGGGRGRRAMVEQHSYRGELPPQQLMHHQQQYNRGGDPALDHNMRQRGPPMYGQNGSVLPSPDYHLPPPHQQQQHPGVHQQRPMNEGYNHPHSHHHPHHHPHHHHPSPQQLPSHLDASQQQQQHPLHYRGYPSYPLEHPAAPYSSPVDHARMLPSSSGNGGGGTPYNANSNNHHQYHQPQPLGPPSSRSWGAGGYTPTGGSTPASVVGSGGDILRRATPTAPAPALQLPPSAASTVRGVSPGLAATAAITVTHPDEQQRGGAGGISTPSGMASASSSAVMSSPAAPPAAPPSSRLSSRPASRAASPNPLVVLPPPASATDAGEPTTAADARTTATTTTTTTTATPPAIHLSAPQPTPPTDPATNDPLTTHLSHLTHLLSTQPSVHHLQRDNADLRARCFALEERAARADARCRELAELLRSNNEMVRVMRDELGDARVGLERAARVREVVRGLLEDLPGGSSAGGGGGAHAHAHAAVAPAPGGPAASRSGHAAGMHLAPR